MEGRGGESMEHREFKMTINTKDGNLTDAEKEAYMKKIEFILDMPERDKCSINLRINFIN